MRLVLPAVTLLFLIGGDGSSRAQDAGADLLRVSGQKGGLCVHLGAADGKLAAELGSGGKFLVQALVLDPGALPAVRESIRKTGNYGRTSAFAARLSPLPYADNMINLLVIEDLPALTQGGLTLRELVRVLVPGGKACLRGTTADGVKKLLEAEGVKDAEVGASGAWVLLGKKSPPGVDDWPQWDHDAARSRASRDMVVDSPDQLRWIAPPRWGEAPQGAVYAGGRSLAVYDENGSLWKMWGGWSTAKQFAAESVRVLVCRDAYNGLLLWKRPLERRAQAGETFCATADRVYLVMGKLVELDAVDGRTLRTFAQAPSAVHLLDAGSAVLVGGGPIRRLDLKTGELSWTSQLVGNNVVVSGDRVYAQLGRSVRGSEGLVCLDLASGKELWRQADPRLAKARLRTCAEGILVLGGGSAYGPNAGGFLHALSAEDGKYLWRHDYPIQPHGGSSDNVFFLGGMVWIRDGGDEQAKKPPAWVGLDPKKGEVKRSLPSAFHHRCCPDAAAGRFLMIGSMDFLDWQTGEFKINRSARVTCGFGRLAAYGMVYTYSHGCECYPMLRGYIGLAATAGKNAGVFELDRTGRLQRGQATAPAGPPAAADDWPVHRANSQRSAMTSSNVPAAPKVLWTAALEGPLSAPTVAAGKVLVARTDAHQVLALNAADGARLWTFDADARVDGPPTYWNGLVMFGGRDGWVYCLRASDGGLVWRFRVARSDRRIIVDEQAESAWPVNASVPVDDGRVLCAAGRHGELDGGITLCAVNAADGALIWERTITGDKLADMLVRSGANFHMKGVKFDPGSGKDVKITNEDRYFTAPSTTLDDLLNVGRTSRNLSGTGADRGSGPPSTQASLLVFDEKRLFGTCPIERGANKSVTGSHALWLKTGLGKGMATTWEIGLDFRPFAMLAAGEKIFVAGSEDVAAPKAFELRVYAADTGRELSRMALDSPPVLDGVAAASGKLFLSCQDGKLRCLGGR